MRKLIESKRDQIAELCKQFRVQHLSAFGSAVREDFDPELSHIDLLVEFEPLSEMRYAPNYFALLDGFTQLFGRQVDLIAANSIRNPYLKAAVEEEKELLYAA